MKRKLIIILCLGIAFFWSSSTILNAWPDQLSNIQGSVTCNCTACANCTKYTNECFHWNSPTPSPSANPCTNTECIKNYDKYAQCPEMAGGGECPVEEDTSLWYLKQERKNGPPAACNTPDYTAVEYIPTDCKALYATFYCVVDSCGGSVTDTVFRGGEYYPYYGRIVCDCD